MYLCRGLHDFDKNLFDMVGVFPFQTAMVKGRAHLGYRQVRFHEGLSARTGGPDARGGTSFHYSRIPADVEACGIDDTG